MKFRKKPVVIDATQWFKNGDHPDDYAEDHEGMIKGVELTITGSYRRDRNWEGGVVRYFRRPDVDGTALCSSCRRTMHIHGWIDTYGSGRIVCPGDYVITGFRGKRYPCRPDLFDKTYDLVEEADEGGPLPAPADPKLRPKTRERKLRGGPTV